MSFILHLGVADLPYATLVPQAARRVKTRARRRGRGQWTDPAASSAAPAGHQTTGEVAEILEARYHIMEVFAEDVGAQKLSDIFAHSAAGAIEDIMSGRPGKISLKAEALSEIEAGFKLFLSLQQLDGIAPGVPTKAALAGVNHRLKHPYAKANPERPSFIDTGLYQASFKAWVDE